jgi:hypothetical protein
VAIRTAVSGDGFRQTAGVGSAGIFTIACWFWHTATVGSSWSTILAYGSASDGIAVQFNGTTGGGLDLSLWDRTVDRPGSTTVLNKWYFFCLTGNGTGANEFKFYLGDLSTPASLDIQGTINLSGLVPDRFVFGNTPPLIEHTSGRFAAIKCWSSALSLSQIQAEQYTYLPQNFSNLISWHPCFVGGATERDLDYSGNGRNLAESGVLTDEDGPPISWGASPVLLPYTPPPPPRPINTGTGLLTTNSGLILLA